ncbi:RFX DNA-binding domain-containing protein [Hypomontagnella submonticulosa]|nr:RFX DNA-binding domain-containing protein [Hypomontagnella submonticulosa]
MAQRNPRKRTLSRASTASIHSVATQPNLDQSALLQQHGAFTDQWVPNEHGPPRDMPQAIQPMPAGDMMLRPASRMQAVQSFPMNPSMQPAVGSAMPYHQHPGLHHAVQSEAFGGNASFTDGDSQMMDRDEGDEVDSLAGRPTGSKPASGRTSANNELEMRQLFQSNKNRTLADVAKELHGNERGPNSERARQIFAMLWISQVCTRGKGSVPRGRVYANYASRCATERITVLNPASFGKLVRVLFPGLKTRRLGVRGESKYHYTEFSLMDDGLELREPPVQPALPLAESTSFAQSFSAPQSQSPALNGHYSALPSPSLMQQPDTQTGPRPTSTRTYSLYNQPNVTDVDLLHSSNSKTVLQLAFLDDFESTSRQAAPLILPNIEPFLPSGTDPDAAKSLTALYRSHCTSLVECIRYCKEKSFFHLYTSFQGTLTMPVQKLFSNPSIAPWIEECDFILYQRMMQIIAHLILQVVPKPILDSFRNISERLVGHIRESFQGQPRHVVQAKEAPAAIFAGLLDRGLRVNLTAHAAANMLSNSANRDQMYLEWLAMVRIRKVAECVPTRGMDDVVDLLLGEIRGLIDPVNVPWEVECQTLYGDLALRGSRAPQTSNSTSRSPESILDHWVTFLQSLPGRFPYATPADIVWCVERAGNEIMRDITLAQGKSFGSWWVTKCWIDEMIAFLAEYGGFLKSKHCWRPLANRPKPSVTDNDVSQESSRAASGSEDLSVPRIPQPQPDRAPFSTQLESNGQDPLQSATNPDDSGIGIRTPEEEFPMGKFDFQAGHDHSLQSLGL